MRNTQWGIPLSLRCSEQLWGALSRMGKGKRRRMASGDGEAALIFLQQLHATASLSRCFLSHLCFPSILHSSFLHGFNFNCNFTSCPSCSTYKKHLFRHVLKNCLKLIMSSSSQRPSAGPVLPSVLHFSSRKQHNALTFVATEVHTLPF